MILTSDAKKLFEQRTNLPGRYTVNAEFAKRIDSELILRRVIPCAHQNAEVGRPFLAEKGRPTPVHGRKNALTHPRHRHVTPGAHHNAEVGRPFLAEKVLA